MNEAGKPSIYIGATYYKKSCDFPTEQSLHTWISITGLEIISFVMAKHINSSAPYNLIKKHLDTANKALKPGRNSPVRKKKMLYLHPKV